jgi:hypothetical protein
MNPYPVVFSVERPERFDRAQLALRIVALLVISSLGLSLGAFFMLLYLFLPVVAAVLLSQKGPARFLEEDGPRLGRALGWVMAVYAYFALLTDRLPLQGAAPGVRYAVTPAGAPTVGGALARIALSLPLALVLALLGCIAWIIWVIAAVMILLTGSYPAGLYDFQCGVLRWLARLLAYHTSLIEQYPPIAFDAGAAPSPVA